MCVDIGNIASYEKGITMLMYDLMGEVSVPQFRLPGFEGAALTLRTLMIPGAQNGSGGIRMALDIGLLSPDRKVEYFARLIEIETISKLSELFWRAATDRHPELSVPILNDESLGLTFAVVSSNDFRVEIQITLVEDLTANVLEFDMLNFETSRVALTSAAADVRTLDGSGSEFSHEDWIET